MSLMHTAQVVGDKPQHDWLKLLNIAFVPGPMDPILQETADGILRTFESTGHVVQPSPNHNTDILITTAPYGQPLNWRKALLFTSRIRYNLEHSPAVFTLVHMRPDQLSEMLAYFERILGQETPQPQDYEFPGLSSQAYKVLHEQGRRGGPILALERLIQAQAKSVKVLLVVGEDRPDYVYHFDLVGAYPKSVATGDERFYEDIVLRLSTTMSTHEVTDHEVVGPLIAYDVWQQLQTPAALRRAAQELGKRKFFTDMVRIAELVQVPAVADSVANQYSEGCFATWEPILDGLIATITGSARPVDKDNIGEDDLAVLTGVRPGGIGAYVRHVEKKRNDPPSSEAVEMLDMDVALPHISLPEEWGVTDQVPVVRSKLHGHRGIASYNPDFVEYVAMDAPYFHYLVSCATEAQARGVKAAFSRSQALNRWEDHRQVVFTILPGHGLVMVEKWVKDKAPLQILWEYMDAGHLVIDSHVPQGPCRYIQNASGRMVLSEDVTSAD